MSDITITDENWRTMRRLAHILLKNLPSSPEASELVNLLIDIEDKHLDGAEDNCACGGGASGHDALCPERGS